MRNVRLIVPALLSAFLGLAAACGSSTSSSGTGSAGDCFDYTGFNGTSPSVSFKTDVVPILSQSCALSTACHGCDPTANPGCTGGGGAYTPFLGPIGGNPSATQIDAIIAATVGQPAAPQASSISTSGLMVGNPSMSIVKAGDAANSFIMYKLDATTATPATDTEVNCKTLACASSGTCGEAMPLNGDQLSSDDRDTIRRWIAQGAQNN
jgi:hypothetical protein